VTNERQKIAELIDACRPMGVDLDLPELSPLATALATDATVAPRLHKSQRIDAHVGAAVRDVPIPPGLEERLLAALASNSLAGNSLAGNSLASSQPFVDAVRRRRSRWHSWPAWSGLALAVSALVVFALLVQPTPVPSLTSQQGVAAQAGLWLANDSEAALSSDKPPTKGFPLPAQPKLTAAQWQRMAGLSTNGDIVCYDASRLETRVLLFVMRSSAGTNLPPTVPIQSYPTTSGWVVGGWHEKGFTFVLAVAGGERYRNIVKPANQVARANVARRSAS